MLTPFCPLTLKTKLKPAAVSTSNEIVVHGGRVALADFNMICLYRLYLPDLHLTSIILWLVPGSWKWWGRQDETPQRYGTETKLWVADLKKTQGEEERKVKRWSRRKARFSQSYYGIPLTAPETQTQKIKWTIRSHHVIR